MKAKKRYDDHEEDHNDEDDEEDREKGKRGNNLILTLAGSPEY